MSSISVKLLTIAVIALTAVLPITGYNNNCESVCDHNEDCLQVCTQALNDSTTSAISDQSCGISSFDRQTVNEGLGRILSGKEAPEHRYPWFASIQYSNDTTFEENYKLNQAFWKRGRRAHFCGGVLVNRRHVITAAHCSIQIESMHVVLGINNLSVTNKVAMVYGVEDMVIHHDFNMKNKLENDIAVIRLDRDVEYVIDEENNRFVVNSVCLPKEEFKFNRNKKVNVAGFGWIKWVDPGQDNDTLHKDIDKVFKERIPITLRETSLLAPTNRQCRQILDKTAEQKYNNTDYYRQLMKELWLEGFINGHKFCLSTALANKLDYSFDNNVYSGDSGGPVLVTSGNRVFTVGVLSFGMYDKYGIPLSGATNVSYHSDWIESNSDIGLEK